MVKIVTDSASDLPLEIAQELDITVVPLTVTIEDEVYKDRRELSPEEFYRRIADKKVVPRTSMVSPQTFYECFQSLVQEGYEVLALIFSSALSGTFQSAVTAKEMIKEGRVEVLDTKAASVGLGLIVMEAASRAKEGATLEEILNGAQAMAQRMEHVFVVDSLDMLKRGGRISPAQAIVGGMLNVKPVLQIDEEGQIISLDKVRGWKKATKRLLEVMGERGKNLENQVIGISHANSLEMALELEKQIKSQYRVKDVFISEIGPVIGAHTGPGTIAVFFQS